jgi:hypothetical protein
MVVVIRGHLPSAFLGGEQRWGGRNGQDYESARPNDDGSVPPERTHNQLVPHSDAGITVTLPRLPSTEAMVPYQGEQNVNACAGAGLGAKARAGLPER